jgi:hypothetical protein
MTFHRRMWIGLLFLGLAGAAGCGVQDSNQPPVGSISVSARKESVKNVPPGKTRPGPADRK